MCYAFVMAHYLVKLSQSLQTHRVWFCQELETVSQITNWLDGRATRDRIRIQNVWWKMCGKACCEGYRGIDSYCRCSDTKLLMLTEMSILSSILWWLTNQPRQSSCNRSLMALIIALRAWWYIGLK